MRRLSVALRLDLRLHRRYGFYYAALFSTLVWVVFVRFIPPDLHPLAVPFILFSDVAILGYFFVAAQVLYEKGEATVYSLAVTPLRFWEYFAAKVVSLTLLALAAGILLVIAGGVAGSVNWFPLTGGIVVTSVLATIVGFLVVTPFRSISEFLIPASLPLIVLGLPIFEFAGLWSSPVFYLLPTQGALLLIGAGFAPIAAGQAWYAVLASLVWAALLVWVAHPAYERFVLGRTGRR